MSLETATRDFQLNPNDPLLAERYLKTLARHSDLKTLASCHFHKPSAQTWKAVIHCLELMPDFRKELCVLALQSVFRSWPSGSRPLPQWTVRDFAEADRDPLSISALRRSGALSLVDSVDLVPQNSSFFNAECASLRQIRAPLGFFVARVAEVHGFDSQHIVKLASKSAFSELETVDLSRAGRKSFDSRDCASFRDFFLGKTEQARAIRSTVKRLVVDGSCVQSMDLLENTCQAESESSWENLDELEIQSRAWLPVLNWPWQSLKKLSLFLPAQEADWRAFKMESSQLLSSLECLKLTMSSVKAIRAARCDKGRQLLRFFAERCELRLTIIIDEERVEFEELDWLKNFVHELIITVDGRKIEFPELPKLRTFVLSGLNQYQECLTPQQIRKIVNRSRQLQELILNSAHASECFIRELKKTPRTLKHFRVFYMQGQSSPEFFADLMQFDIDRLDLELSSVGNDSVDFAAHFQRLQARYLKLKLYLSPGHGAEFLAYYTEDIQELSWFCGPVAQQELKEILQFQCFVNLEKLSFEFDLGDYFALEFWQDLSFEKLVELKFQGLNLGSELPIETEQLLRTWPSLLRLGQ